MSDGTNAGNGNGFKMGGDSLPGNHKLYNSFAYDNKAKGLDSNSGPNIEFYNCTSFNNGGSNVALYTNDRADTAYIVEGLVSFRTKAFDVAENFKLKGSQDQSKVYGVNNYFYDTAAQTGANSEGKKVDASWFVNTDSTTDVLTRNADGTINMNGFLELNAKAPAGSGTTGASTASPELVIIPNEECTFATERTNSDMYVHWYECECGNKSNITEHTFEYVTDIEPTDVKPGYKHNECTEYGYKRPSIEIPALKPPVDNTAPNFFTDFFGWWAWLFQMIGNFFKSLFGF
jgi:hypothetical protein